MCRYYPGLEEPALPTPSTLANLVGDQSGRDGRKEKGVMTERKRKQKGDLCAQNMKDKTCFCINLLLHDKQCGR